MSGLRAVPVRHGGSRAAPDAAILELRIMILADSNAARR
jgi:hypothetical protein